MSLWRYAYKFVVIRGVSASFTLWTLVTVYKPLCAYLIASNKNFRPFLPFILLYASIKLYSLFCLLAIVVVVILFFSCLCLCSLCLCRCLVNAQTQIVSLMRTKISTRKMANNKMKFILFVWKKKQQQRRKNQRWMRPTGIAIAIAIAIE